MKNMFKITKEWFNGLTTMRKAGWIAAGVAFVPGVIIGVITKSSAVFIGVITLAVAAVITLAVSHIAKL
jgi:hypothetical protein